MPISTSVPIGIPLILNSQFLILNSQLFYTPHPSPQISPKAQSHESYAKPQQESAHHKALQQDKSNDVIPP